jgi:2-oxo-4-hydroxy-4-carboxy-5-ureidoimidazoline decarboxylase
MMQTRFGRRRLWQGAVAIGIVAAAPRLAAQTRLTLDEVNRMDEAAFVKAFGDVYELSPWVARGAFARRPFATVTALHQALAESFTAAPREQQRKFLHDLSDIGDKSANPATVTAASHQEQGVAGIKTLGPTDQALLEAMNKAYRAKFDIAFVVGVRRHTTEDIFAQYMRRLNNGTLEGEVARAIHEQHLITRIRIAEMVTGPGMPKVYGDITAHVLDATLGKPAGGVAVEIYELWADKSRKVGSGTTTVDGRVSLMEGLPLPIGRYELRFGIGDYFRKRGAFAAGEKPFLDVVPMRVFIANAEDSYHFPLIASPFGYTIHG